MNTRNAHPSRSSAFTLIELLVVIGLIGLLAGGLGVAMQNKNPGSGLRSAQSILVSLLSSARGQSALNQANAMILVQANPGDPNFLRSVKVVVETAPPGSNNWQEVGGEVVLPEGIYIVPPVDNMAGAEVSTKGENARLSQFVAPSAGLINGVTGTYFTSMYLTCLGGVSNAGNKVTTSAGRMLVAAGAPISATAVKIDNTSAIRGFVVSNYGVATLINDVASFAVAAPAP
jgi:prepilin-type N-terminal cleavage/methylation domain-containing protein